MNKNNTRAASQDAGEAVDAKKKKGEGRPREIFWPRVTLFYYMLPAVVLAALSFVFLDYTHGWRALLDSIFTWRFAGIGFVVACFTVYGVANFGKCLVHMAGAAISEERIENGINFYVQATGGNLAAGKTSSSVFKAKLFAALQEKKAKEALCFLANLKNRNESEEADYQETQKAVEFYAAHPEFIPYLVSNTPIWDEQDRHSMVLTMCMMEQKQCIPAYSVILIDEVGDVFDPKAFRAQAVIFVNESFKYARQYGEWRIILCEQDVSNTIIGSKRTISRVEYMKSQKAALKPVFLKWVRDRISARAEKNDYKISRPWVAELYRILTKFINNMGFRVYKVKSTGNFTQQGAASATEDEKNYTLTLPAALNCCYNDRAYRKGYLAKNSPIEGKAWAGMCIPEETIQQMRDFKIKSLKKEESDGAKPPKGKKAAQPIAAPMKENTQNNKGDN